jgi:hypothetical protein
MTVRCAHCGEELLGAVNRCWKCGQQFVARPTVEGLPPVRVEAEQLAAVTSQEPLEARVLDDAEVIATTETTVLTASPRAEHVGSNVQERQAATLPPPSIFPPPPNPLSPASAYASPLAYPAMQRPSPPRTPPRPNLAALGGAYAALFLGFFGLVLAPFRWEAAIVGFCGVLMGLWGVYSPRRNWALVGMLLCVLAIGWGGVTGVNDLWLYLNRNAPIVQEEPAEEDAIAP